MSLMIDSVLRTEIAAGKLIKNIDIADLQKVVRGCAIDLHIGDIYRPGVISGADGSAGNPLKLQVTLNEGETAIIQTYESFILDSSHAAFAFPASSVSVQGLLMTNPGHIDPGYQGPLHVTVINMGRQPYTLLPGQRFLRAFIHDLHSNVASPKPPTPPNPVRQELLDKLSPDFLSVNERTIKSAKREVASAVQRNQNINLVIPIVAAIVASVLTNCSNTVRYEDRIKALEGINSMDRLKSLELSYPNEKRLLEIEEAIKKSKAEK